MGHVRRLLLDSHILLWCESAPDRLSDAQRLEIAQASEVYVSAASAWELEMKRVSGKLMFVGSVAEIARRFGFIELSISMAHGVRAAELPMLHKDPFDRMLVAQSVGEGLLLVTADQRLSRYGIKVLA